MQLPLTLFLSVVAVGGGLIVVAALALAAWVTFNIVADSMAAKAKKS